VRRLTGTAVPAEEVLVSAAGVAVVPGALPLTSVQGALDLERIEGELDAVCAAPESRIERVARHALDGVGKRARPRLSFAVGRALGRDLGADVALVVASELAHTGSLLHDDIIDGARTRRGRAAGHVAYDVPTAILAGDLLLTLAMERVAGRGPRALQVALAAAVRDLTLGAALERERLFDLEAGLDNARRVNRLKTGALFAYAAEAGAILAGARGAHRAAAHAYGLALGEAFQTADDLLDLTGDPSTLGKPIGQDLAAGEITVPVALALERDPGLDDVVLEVWRTTRSGADPGGLLVELRDRMKLSGAVSAASAIAREDADRARAALDLLPAGPWRDRLGDLARAAVDRRK
jgi:octaprenyl-diphosphate synthase